MADDFKTLVALTKETNAKLELLHKQGDDNDSPRERILDALPEILAAKDISKKEMTIDYGTGERTWTKMK